MKKRIKTLVIRLIPDILWDYYRLLRYRTGKSRKVEPPDVSDTFHEIYKANRWNSDKSASGTGSDWTQTEEIRELIPVLLKRQHIRTMLDIPCRDFNWMKKVDLGETHYTGANIVPELIENNTRQYSAEKVTFKILNLPQDDLPQADLVLCRDCLVHFSYAHIEQAIGKLKSSGSKYFLTTSFTQRRFNFDIDTGDWRPINLRIKPFFFPQPVDMILEKCTEGNGKSYDKSLLLFVVADLPDKLMLS